MFAASLSAFVLASKRIEAINEPDNRHKELIEILCGLTNISPLARLASISEFVESRTQGVIIAVIKDYDEILMLLGTRGTRGKLKSGSSGDAAARFEALAEAVQGNLELIFFEDDLLRGLTRRYSLF